MVKGPTRLRELIFYFFYLCSDVPQFLACGVKLEYKQIFLQEVFRKMHRKLFIHRKRRFSGIFQTLSPPIIFKMEG